MCKLSDELISSMNSSKPPKKGSELHMERSYRELILYVPFIWLISDRTPSQTDLRNEESLSAHINMRFRVAGFRQG